METRAHFIVIGGFVVVFLVGIFTFIYWLQNAGGFGRQAEYRIQFNEPAPGLKITPMSTNPTPAERAAALAWCAGPIARRRWTTREARARGRAWRERSTSWS